MFYLDDPPRWRIVLLIMLLAAVYVPLADAGPFAPESYKLNRELSKALSRRLSDPVVVYDTDWFRIIASKSYEKRIERDVAPAVVEAVAEFRNLFGIEREASLWEEGVKGSLVFLKTRKVYRKYLAVFDEEAEPDRLSPGFADAVEPAQSFYWLEPIPYAVACGEGANFEDMNKHVFHLLGHVLLTWNEYNYKFAPPWLHEGYGAYMAMRYAGGNLLYCTQGLNNCVFGTGVFSGMGYWARSENWSTQFRQKKYLDTVLHLDELSRLHLEEFDHPEVAQSWSFVTFLISEHPKKLKKFLSALKQQPREMAPDSEWPPTGFSEETFRKTFGLSLQEMEPLWKAWAETMVLAGNVEPGKMKGRTSEGGIKFDPALHLEEFTLFEGNGPQEELAPFLKRSGEWMAPEDLDELRTDWSRVRDRLIVERERARNEKLTQENTGAGVTRNKMIAAKGAQYLVPGEIAALINVDTDPGVYRSVVCYLARKHGCFETYLQIARALEGGSLVGLEAELDLLEQAALLEAELFDALCRERVSLALDFMSGKAVLHQAEEGMLVCRGKKGVSVEALPPRCRVDETDEGVEIRCPFSHVSLKPFLSLCKNRLKRKGDDDRLGYGMLLLFRGDVAGYRKEIKSIKAAGKELDRLEGIYRDYGKAVGGAEVLALLAGEAKGTAEENVQELQSLRGELEALKAKQEAIAWRLQFERQLQGNTFLRSFQGFEGIDETSGLSRFKYEFDDAAEEGDFDLEPPLLEEHLQERYEAGLNFSSEPFHVERGVLQCFGTDFITLKPVFSGDVEVRLKLRISHRDDDAANAPFYALFGYALDETGGYVASSCLYYLETLDKLEKGTREVFEAAPNAGTMERGRVHDLVLKREGEKVSYALNGAEASEFDVKGHDRGRVFFWGCGPREFQIEELEVQGRIDPDWLGAAIDAMID